MSHQNLNLILQMHQERLAAHLAETQKTRLRKQVGGQQHSWISARTRPLLRRIGSQLVAWGEWLECYGYRELSPSR